MSEAPLSDRDFDGASREDVMAAIFVQMILQQVNMATMLLGRMPHPQTGKTVFDLDAAQMFIDQLEVLQVKTKGNLSKQEEQLLTGSLTSLRMAFVEAVHAEKKTDQPADAPAPPPPAEVAPSATVPEPEAAPESETKKKFSKKY
jgi:hypothetical protein